MDELMVLAEASSFTLTVLLPPTLCLLGSCAKCVFVWGHQYYCVFSKVILGTVVFAEIIKTSTLDQPLNLKFVSLSEQSIY